MENQNQNQNQNPPPIPTSPSQELLSRFKQYIPSFCFLLIMWTIAIKKSHAAFLTMAEEMQPGNPLCSHSKPCLRIRAILHLALCGQILCFYIMARNFIDIRWPELRDKAEVNSPSSEDVNKFGRKMAILISCVALVVLSLADRYEDSVPVLAGAFAVCRSLFFVVSFLLGIYWISGTVGQDIKNGKYEQKWKKNQKRFTFG